MPAKRIIPCLDIAHGRVVKGVKFNALNDAGDPIALAVEYERQGADEIVILDIEASSRGSFTLAELVKSIAQATSIPLCAGGGICTLEDVTALLLAGADKVSLCTTALNRPFIITEIAQVFGSQCAVVSIDAKRKGGAGIKKWTCYKNGGRIDTGIDVVDWAQQVQELGAGEILLNSIDMDGTGAGYDLELIEAVSKVVTMPIIASSGAGCAEHLKEALRTGRADAVLLAGLLHRGIINITLIKEYLSQKGVEVR